MRSSSQFVACVAVLAGLFVGASRVAAAPTDAELDALGKRLERLVNERDHASFAKTWDRDAFIARVFRNMNTPAAREIEAGVRGEFEKMAGGLVAQLPPEGRLTYLHHRKVGEEQRLTFRLNSDQGLNYWDCIIEPSPADQTPKIVDIHIALTGEPFTQTLQRLFLRLTMSGGAQPTPEEVEAMKSFQQFTAAAKSGDGRQALKLYDTLPDKLKKEKMTQLLRLMSAARIADEPELANQVADEFQQRFGDDPACDLVMVDAHFTRNRLDDAATCLQRVDKSVGGDPYIDTMIAGIYLSGGDVDKAKAAALRAHERDAKQFDAIDTLLSIAAHEKDFVGMKKYMLLMESDPAFGFRFSDDLNGVELFNDFKASPQYQEWLNERPK